MATDPPPPGTPAPADAIGDYSGTHTRSERANLSDAWTIRGSPTQLSVTLGILSEDELELEILPGCRGKAWLVGTEADAILFELQLSQCALQDGAVLLSDTMGTGGGRIQFLGSGTRLLSFDAEGAYDWMTTGGGGGSGEVRYELTGSSQ